MKQFASFVRKEFHHILRDTWTMIILLVLPVVMLVLFGFALSTEVKDVRLGIYDPSRDHATDAIVERLASSRWFTVARYLDNPFDMDAAFRSGEVGMIVVFSPGFAPGLTKGRASVQLIADGSDPNVAVTMTTYARAIIAGYLSASLPAGSAGIEVNSRLLYNPEMKSAYTFVPGVMGMVIMLICAMMTSISIAREKETGTMEILLVSPLNPLLIILSKAVPYFFLSCVNLLTIILFAVFLLGVPVSGSLPALLLISLVYIFVSLAIGLLISSVAATQVAALLMSGMALMMPAMYLSGMMFPVENIPFVFRIVARMVPARWYILAVKDLMIKGLGFAAILPELGVLSAMAVVLIAVSFKRFKLRLE